MSGLVGTNTYNNKASLCGIVFLLSGAMLSGSETDIVRDTLYPSLSTAVYIIFSIVINILFVITLIRFTRATADKRSFFSELTALFFIAFTNIFIFAAIYTVNGINEEFVGYGDALTSLYFSMVTWATLGYGDISPEGGIRFIATVEALMGYTYMAILVGLFLTIFNSSSDMEDTQSKSADKNESTTVQKITTVKEIKETTTVEETTNPESQ